MPKIIKTLEQVKDEYISLLERINSNLRHQLRIVSNPEEEKVIGVVYVLRQVGTDNYKIGYSSNYKKRKYMFDVKLPFDIEEVIVHETDNFIFIEKELHKLFSESRLNNSEFFSLTDEQIESLPQVIRELDDNTQYNIPENKNELNDIQIEEDEEEEYEEVDKDADLVIEAKALMEKHSLTSNTLSSSFLQRKLSLGYARAARIKDKILGENEKQNEEIEKEEVENNTTDSV